MKDIRPDDLTHPKEGQDTLAGVLASLRGLLKTTLEVALFVSTLLVLVYFASISYYPLDSLGSIAALAVPLSFFGGLGALAGLFFLAAPTTMFVFIANADRDDPVVAPLRVKDGEKNQVSLTRCIAFLVLSQGMAGAFLLGLLDSGLQMEGVQSAVLVTSFLLFWIGFGFYLALSRGISWNWVHRALAYLAVALFSVAPLYLAFLMIGRSPALRGVTGVLVPIVYYATPLLAPLFGAFVLWTTLLARRATDGALLSVVALTAALFALLQGLQLGTDVLNNLMTAVTLRVPNATLLVNQAACVPLLVHGVKLTRVSTDLKAQATDDLRVCGPEGTSTGLSVPAAGGRVYRVENVVILSRVGSEWPLQFGDGSQPRRTTVVIPRTNILDWHAAPPKP